MSTDPTPESERRQIVKDDARKLPQPGEKGDCYMRRAASMIGSELGGRFQRLAEQSVVGHGPTPYPHLPSGPWAEGDPTGDEKPLGFSVDVLPDMTRVKP
jgi:hypothetical protein